MGYLSQFGRKRIYNDSNEKTEYNTICSRSMDNAMKRFIKVITVVMFSFIAALIGPVYAFVRDGVLTTVLGVRVPYVEKGSHLEFKILLIMQLFSGFCGFCGNFGIEAGYNLFINVIRTTTDFIIKDIDSLTHDIETKTFTFAEKKRKLSLIFLKINAIDRYCLI